MKGGVTTTIRLASNRWTGRSALSGSLPISIVLFGPARWLPRSMMMLSLCTSLSFIHHHPFIVCSPPIFTSCDEQPRTTSINTTPLLCERLHSDSISIIIIIMAICGRCGKAGASKKCTRCSPPQFIVVHLVATVSSSDADATLQHELEHLYIHNPCPHGILVVWPVSRETYESGMFESIDFEITRDPDYSKTRCYSPKGSTTSPGDRTRLHAQPQRTRSSSPRSRSSSSLVDVPDII
eukprot:scaffold2914_cov178-Amphora_coffeaeformis.AAC.15